MPVHRRILIHRGAAAMITLTAGDSQILLPSAELNDEHEIDAGLKLKRMMNGSKKSFIRTPALATLSYTLKSMNRNKIEEMRLFLIATAGQQVRLRDWDNRLWIGHITNNPTTFTHADVRDNQFNLNFEGFLYPGE